MGEKIKDLSSFCVGDTVVKIELNDGYSKSYSKYDIHIQSDSLQYCLSNKEFMNLVSVVLTAERRIKSMKGID